LNIGRKFYILRDAYLALFICSIWIKGMEFELRGLEYVCVAPGARTAALTERKVGRRNNWGAQRSALLLQGFVELVVGKERIAKAQAVADENLRR
jgi:hypothetical protein